MHWNEVWHGASTGARLVRFALTPLSWLYEGGWRLYVSMYQVGLKTSVEPHKPVICVGNLVTGGSGKSPVTLYLADVLKSLGHDVVISCSGYGSPRSEQATVAPAGDLDAFEWGDEPAMMRWLSPDIPMIVGRNRVRAAEICHDRFPSAVLLLDDGFQHLPLKKHLSIVLDPPTTNTRCIPAGPYREPRGNRKRADLCLPNGFAVSMRINCLVDPSGNPVTIAQLTRINVACALGNPSRFLGDLSAMGLRIESAKTLPDHDNLQMGNLFESMAPGFPVVVTAKDWVKLQHRKDTGNRQFFIARQVARIEPEAEFMAWLTQKLNELTNK